MAQRKSAPNLPHPVLLILKRIKINNLRYSRRLSFDKHVNSIVFCQS